MEQPGLDRATATKTAEISKKHSNTRSARCARFTVRPSPQASLKRPNQRCAQQLNDTSLAAVDSRSQKRSFGKED